MHKRVHKKIKKSNSAKLIISIFVLIIVLAIISVFAFTNLSSKIQDVFPKENKNTEIKGPAIDCINLGIDKDYFSFGSILVKYKNSSEIFGDYCEDLKNVIEYSCKNKEIVTEKYECSIGCYERACISPQDINLVFDKNLSQKCNNYYTISPSNAVAQNQFGSYSALNAIDNDLLTRWYSLPDTYSLKWIYFDLGNKKCISTLDLYTFRDDIPINIKIQASNDAIIWTTIKSNFNITQAVEKDIYISPDVVARYVRIIEYSSNRSYGTLSDIRLYVADIK